MTKTITAVFENGLLRPDEPLDLEAGQRVELRIRDDKPWLSPEEADNILRDIDEQFGMAKLAKRRTPPPREYFPKRELTPEQEAEAERNIAELKKRFPNSIGSTTKEEAEELMRVIDEQFGYYPPEE